MARPTTAPGTHKMTTTLENFLNGTNATYIAELYARFLENPNSVDPSWVSFFSELQEDGRAVLDELRGASWSRSDGGVIGRDGGNGEHDAAAPVIDGAPAAGFARGLAGLESAGQVRAATQDSVRALMLIRSYRVRGHLIARFDPLGLEGNTHHPELDPKTYGFTEADMDRPHLHRPRAGTGSGDDPRDPPGAAGNLLRVDRRRVSCTSWSPRRRPGSSVASRASATRPSSP